MAYSVSLYIEFFWINFGVMRICFFQNYVWWHFNRIIQTNPIKSANSKAFLKPTDYGISPLQQKCSQVYDAVINLICILKI